MTSTRIVYALAVLLALSLGANTAVTCELSRALVRSHRGCP